MSIYLPSVGGKEPYWGPQTSHMNFCEEDYHVTSYIGEFINTLTSLFYTYLGYHGIAMIWSRGERSLLPFLPSFAVIVLGLCSAVYHASLKYYMQLLDDNSMLFGAAIILHRLLAYAYSTPAQLISALIITVGVCGAIWAHIELGESTLHQIVFASMMLTSLCKTFALISSKVADADVRRQMRAAGWMYLILFLTGYALWNIDNQFCSDLRRIRHSVGLPWAWLLELHGWWHILTGLGVYTHTCIVECLCPIGRDKAAPLTLEERLPSIAYFGIKRAPREGDDVAKKGKLN